MSKVLEDSPEFRENVVAVRQAVMAAYTPILDHVSAKVEIVGQASSQDYLQPVVVGTCEALAQFMASVIVGGYMGQRQPTQLNLMTAATMSSAYSDQLYAQLVKALDPVFHQMADATAVLSKTGKLPDPPTPPTPAE